MLFAVLSWAWIAVGLTAVGPRAAVAGPAPPDTMRHAQAPVYDAVPMRFRRLTSDEGLPATAVHHVMQDRRGFTWLSTRRGVIRYDGRSFVPFRHDPLDANSLSASTVWVTEEDRRGWIWMGTLGGGLSIYRPETDDVLHVAADPSDASALQSGTVTALHEDARGRMWVGTDGGGLSRARVMATGDSVQVAFDTYRAGSESASLTNDRILDVAETADGRLWLATYGGGLNLLDPSTGAVRAWRHDPAAAASLSDDYVMSVSLDEAGGLWAGTKYGGLSYVSPAGRVTRVRVERDGVPVDFVWRTAMIDGVLWVGTYGSGLFRLHYQMDDGRPVVQRTEHHGSDPANPHSLSDDFVLSIMRDRSGVVWCGTDNDGVNLFYDAGYVRPIEGRLGAGGPSVRRTTVTTVAQRGSRLWVGTTVGLFERSGPGPMRPIPLPKASSYVERIVVARDGRLWVCTNRGLFLYDPSTGELTDVYAQMRATGMRVNDRFFDVVERPGGAIWAATDRGVTELQMRGRQLESARPVEAVNQRFAAPRIRRLVAEGRRVWVGTTGSGLGIVTETADGLRVALLHDLLEQPAYAAMKVLDVAHAGSDVWVATYGGGVVHLRDGTPMRTYTEGDGLPDRIVRSVAIGPAGDVWITTARGLARKQRGDDRFERVALPVPGVGGVGRMHLAPGGPLYVMGTQHGLVAVETDRAAHIGGSAPQVAVTGVEVMGERVPVPPLPVAEEEAPTDSPSAQASGPRAAAAPRSVNRTTEAAVPEVRLDPDASFVTVEFAVLDHAWPPANRMQYRLRESRTPWQPLGSDGRVSLSHLAPGRYTLEVRGAGLSGTWSEVPTRLRLNVAPAYWETTGFRVGIVLAVLALLGGVVQLRRRAQQRLERTRRRIADDLHDDLGSKISSVALMIDVAGRDADPRHQPLLREASTTAREVARDLRDAIWLVDTGRDTLGAFLKHTRTVAARISPTRPVAIDASGPLHVPLSMEQRRHLLLFVKEALHNAVRHAEATEIRVACRLDDGRLRLSVEDDGVGFSPDTTCGRGLRTMPHRADALGGTFTLDTTPGHGTRATIAFDLY